MSASSSSAWAPWRASARFAESLVSRHARSASKTSPVGRATLRGAHARTSQRPSRFDVRVSVQFPIGPATSRPDARASRGGAPPPGTYLRAPNAPSSPFGASGPTHAALVVARATRLERVPLARRADSSLEERRVASPVSRVVRRGATVDTTAPSRDAQTMRSESVRDARHGRHATTTRIDATTPLSRPELDRITTHVVDAIDRRIAAARERHGRI